MKHTALNVSVLLARGQETQQNCWGNTDWVMCPCRLDWCNVAPCLHTVTLHNVTTYEEGVGRGTWIVFLFKLDREDTEWPATRALCLWISHWALQWKPCKHENHATLSCMREEGHEGKLIGTEFVSRIHVAVCCLCIYTLNVLARVHTVLNLHFRTKKGKVERLRRAGK